MKIDAIPKLYLRKVKGTYFIDANGRMWYNDSQYNYILSYVENTWDILEYNNLDPKIFHKYAEQIEYQIGDRLIKINRKYVKIVE